METPSGHMDEKLKKLWDLCSSSDNQWYIADPKRDSSISEYVASVRPLSDALSVTHGLAWAALLEHVEKIHLYLEENLPPVFKSVEPERQTGTEIEESLKHTLKMVSDEVWRTRRSLEVFTNNLGAEAKFANDFLQAQIYAEAERGLPANAGAIIHKVMEERFRSRDLRNFQKFCEEWSVLGLKTLILDAAWNVISSALLVEVETSCHGVYDTPALAGLHSWMADLPIPFLECILAGEDSAELEKWRSRLEFHMLYSVAEMRVNELFDIIVDFPDSEPVLEDLKVSLMRTGLNKELVNRFKRQLDQRLLHPGAQTADIIGQYVNVVKALRQIDASGVIVEIVCEPIRLYLRGRSDTIRCIVSEVTEDDGELLEVLEDAVQDDEDSGSEGDAFDEWEPDPADAPSREEHGESGFGRGDALARLFDIYGSREVFADEYRKMLGVKLLTSEERGGDVEREIRNVEMFKARFGTEAMQDCAVMLKDIGDTRRIVALGTAELKELDREPEFIIMSKHFWPKLPEGDGPLPEMFAQYGSILQKHFEMTKAPRKLRWQPDLGVVKVKVELDNGKIITATVTPNQAGLFSCFEDCAEWSIKDLATKMDCDEDRIKSLANVWIQRGLLRTLEGDLLQVVENVDEDLAPFDVLEKAMENNDEAFSEVKGEKEDMKVYESFVIGMLTNLGSLTSDRIHNMLKIFCMNPTFDKTPEQLQSLLDDLVAEEKITISGRQYSLPQAKDDS